MAKRKRKQVEPTGTAPFAHLRGLGYALAVTAIFIVLATLLVSVTSITEATARWIAVGGGMIAVIVGGFYTGRQMGKAGLINGGATGVAFVVVLLLLALLLDMSLSGRSLITSVLGIAMGAVGGVLGVNR